MPTKNSQTSVHDTMEKEPLPLVSIGVPVYNEERFLTESLESLQAQDYGNLEIIIADNASTDNTPQICRRIAAADDRITYHRFEENCGITENFRRTLRLSSGSYFMWAAGHDIWSSNLISECVSLLSSEPQAVIAFGSSQWIDDHGNPILRSSGWTDTRGMDCVGRFHSVLWGNMHPVLGLIRAEALRRARTVIATAGSDLILLCELVLQGHFVHATKASWYRRDHRGKETHEQRMERYQSREFGLSRSLRSKSFPLFHLPFELFKAVLRSRITWFEKMCILFTLMPALPVRYLTVRKQQD
ncbi:MAG: glycosyltransferase family 2 protein [Gammaproteobacteria bacterium]|jgi:glycosyltransferase involved in cell wall biosynthesis|nr:glycosyltransferase family 2 protein [Gammaproteobacteria bacterium]